MSKTASAANQEDTPTIQKPGKRLAQATFQLPFMGKSIAKKSYHERQQVEMMK